MTVRTSIRGSGSHGTDFAVKGGVSGFNALVRALQEGCSVAMTADIPKVSRVATKLSISPKNRGSSPRPPSDGGTGLT